MASTNCCSSGVCTRAVCGCGRGAGCGAGCAIPADVVDAVDDPGEAVDAGVVQDSFLYLQTLAKTMAMVWKSDGPSVRAILDFEIFDFLVSEKTWLLRQLTRLNYFSIYLSSLRKWTQCC